jgi:hypothetical protein
MSKRYEFCAPWATSGCLHSTWLHALVPSLHETIFWVCRFAFLLSFSFAGNRRHAIILIEVNFSSFFPTFHRRTGKNVFFLKKTRFCQNVTSIELISHLCVCFIVKPGIKACGRPSNNSEPHRTYIEPRRTLSNPIERPSNVIERLSNPVEPRRTPSNVYRTSIEPHRTCIEPNWRCLQLLLNFCSNDCGGR